MASTVRSTTGDCTVDYILPNGSLCTDVPPCNETDKSKCTYTITSNFTAGDMNGCGNGCQFITMEGHWCVLPEPF